MRGQVQHAESQNRGNEDDSAKREPSRSTGLDISICSCKVAVYNLPLQQHVRRYNTGDLKWCDSEGSMFMEHGLRCHMASLLLCKRHVTFLA
jgi:hypothetical protein